jgi:integrase
LRARGNGVAALALEFTILTAARTGEVLGAHWLEIDTRAAVWTVPADRMKAQRQHRVPLSAEALRVLERARALHNGDSLSQSSL